MPKREKGEEAQKFMGRCMTSEVMSKEYPDQKQRVAVCTAQSRAGADKFNFAEMYKEEFVYADYQKDCECGEVEELTESNFVVPEQEDYEDFGEEVEVVDAASLWDNIRKKKEREGKNYKPAKKGDKDRPDPKAWKKAKGESIDLLVKPGKDYVIKQDVEEYLRGLLIAINEDSSYDIAYWYDKLEPYPIEVIVDGKSIAKDAKIIKLNFHPEIDKTDALQYGKPKKDDPRKTPSKPSERKKGSKKNKPDSASKPNKSIKFGKNTNERLRKMMTEHNKKDKGSKASMGALKAVYRRGAGAFSTSHAPNMSRDGWAMARVRAFLYLLRNGKPSNPNYKQDNDLLPKGHPKKSSKADASFIRYELEFAAKYQGRTVTLNKPFRTPGGPKKRSVYVKNQKGNVVKVNFGDPNMKIKKSDPARRRNFRARHRCDTPGPKWKARYWSCKAW